MRRSGRRALNGQGFISSPIDMLKYLQHYVIHSDTMSTTISLRLSEDLAEQLEEIAQSADRSKSYLIKKAIEQYLAEYADYRIALDRLHDVRDEIISSKELRKRLASGD